MTKAEMQKRVGSGIIIVSVSNDEVVWRFADKIADKKMGLQTVSLKERGRTFENVALRLHGMAKRVESYR